jgi:serine protease Do
MDDIMILDAVERYIRGEMNPDERLYFENLRKTNPDVDQLVVEHTLFLQQMNRFGEWKKFRTTLHDVHTDLAEQGKINSARLKGKAKIVYLWNRYKRVTAIAATIAGITAIVISGLVWSLTPKPSTAEFAKLNRKLIEQEDKTNQLRQDLNTVKKKVNEPVINYKTGGTSFLIDPKGYLVTNAHVIQGARHIAVENKSGDDYAARVVYTDAKKDIAILKIEDSSFKTTGTIPYAINKLSNDLAEPIFTLGYPRNEIVYGQGYLSAKTGYNGDTLSCQIEIAANRGNSGSPILNRNGEVIGILNGRQTNTDGFVFAIHSRYIFQAFEELKKDTTYRLVKLPLTSSIKGLERTQQVRKVQDCVFMVKVN